MRTRVAVVLVAAALSLAGCASTAADLSPASPAATTSSVAPAPVADPLRVTVPAISLDAPLVGLGLNPDHTLAVPPLDKPEQVGWYSGGVKPGQPGPAVIVSHVDAYGHPGGGNRFHSLKAGDPITVARADGSTITFRVTHVDLVHKDSFPTSAIYGDTAGPELRLITCGGPLDAAAHSYTDNVVVFGVLAA
jgi:hypothetical protein